MSDDMVNSDDESIEWRTSTGKVLTLGQMTTQHLKNTARMLRKKAADENSSYWSFGSMLHGEMAIDFWEAAQDEMEDTVCELNELADVMERVMNKRLVGCAARAALKGEKAS